MPFPRPTFLTELAEYPEVLLEFDQYSALNAQWASREHHGDGTHKDITADSIDVLGDLTVLGGSAFEDVVGNAAQFNEIVCDELSVETLLTWATAMQSAALDSGASLPIWEFTGSSPALKIRHPSGTDEPIFLFNTGGLSLGNSGGPFAVEFDLFGNAFVSGDLEVDTTTFVVDATNHRVGIGTASPSATLHLAGESLAVKNQNAASTWTFQNTDNTNATSRSVINMLSGTVDVRLSALSTSAGILGTNSNHQLVFYTNSTNRIVIAAGGDVEIDGSTFHVDATNNRVGIGTASPSVALDVTGAIAAAGDIDSGGAITAAGDIETIGVFVNDGTSGGTEDVDVGLDGGGTTTLHFKGGIYTGRD